MLWSERNKRRIANLKLFIAICNAGFVAVLMFSLLKLNQIGLLKLTKNTVITLAILLFAIVIIKRMKLDTKKY